MFIETNPSVYGNMTPRRITGEKKLHKRWGKRELGSSLFTKVGE
jgi:hypothetical protein